MSQYENEGDLSVMSKESVELKEPSMYRCILLNDDYTPMDFVVTVLMKIFGKNEDESQAIMINVHKKGKGVCGVYTFEVAETKIKQVEMLAEKYGFPLSCEIEEDK